MFIDDGELTGILRDTDSVMIESSRYRAVLGPPYVIISTCSRLKRNHSYLRGETMGPPKSPSTLSTAVVILVSRGVGKLQAIVASGLGNFIRFLTRAPSSINPYKIQRESARFSSQSRRFPTVAWRAWKFQRSFCRAVFQIVSDSLISFFLKIAFPPV